MPVRSLSDIMANDKDSASLQLPQHVESNGQSVVVVHESLLGKCRKGVRIALKWLTEVDTGAPSLGLSSSEDTSPPDSDHKAGQVIFDDEENYFVDQIFVHADELPSVDVEADSVHESVNYSMHSASTSSAYYPPLSYFLRRIGHHINNFFSPHFKDPAVETEYCKEVYYRSKPWAACASGYLVINWVLYLVVNHSSTNHSLYAEIVFYGGLTLFTLPLPFLVASDWYIHHSVVFQVLFVIGAWWCGITEVIQMKQCHFFTDSPDHCFGKNFLSTLYYVTAVPAITMFTAISQRLYNAVMQIICLGLLLGLIIPDRSVYARNLVSFIIFSLFIQGLHYSKEMNGRRVFSLRRTVTYMYRKLDKAKRTEFAANTAKSRFASYIFHEVRVPLNVAQLSYDYIEFAKGFDFPNTDIETEVNALGTNLIFMQKVLNDALDFNRLDEGSFNIHPKPFPFHYTVKAILRDLNVAAFHKGLKLQIHLDPEVDRGLDMRNSLSGGTWADGDDIRLRQIITNLTSNAIKFTPHNGGDIHVSTKLVGFHRIESSLGHRCDISDPRECDHFVVRVEVSDNGPGISPEELRRNHLFEPYEQAAAGQRIGKGSGLGLAIVKQIVKRSHGSLGLKSSRGHGATFWFELPFKLASEKQVKSSLEDYTYPSIDMDQEGISQFERERWKDLHNWSPSLSTPGHIGLSSFPGLNRKETIISPPPATIISTNPGEKLRTWYESINPLTTPQLSEPPGILCTPERPDTDDPIRVLVVDDDPMTRTIIAKHFRTFGCSVDVAEDGLDFVEKAAVKNFDLITLDNRMPRLTGEESIRRFRDMGREDYVVGCTGNAIESDRGAFMDAGVNELFPKPIHRSTLEQLFREAVRRRQLYPQDTTTNEEIHITRNIIEK